MKNAVAKRVEELCRLLPEEVQEEMRWLLHYAVFKERPRGHERLEALSKVLPEAEAEELRGLFANWKTDFEQEAGIFQYVSERYPTDGQSEMFFAVYGAYNGMPAAEFKMNWQTAMACAG